MSWTMRKRIVDMRCFPEDVPAQPHASDSLSTRGALGEKIEHFQHLEDVLDYHIQNSV